MINKVLLTGRLTSDIELRRTNDGTTYSYFTVAVNRTSSKNETDFISCVVWRKSAELMKEYLKKGSLIGIEGRLEVYRLDQNGTYQTRTNVNVSQVHFLETRQQPSGQANESDFSMNQNSQRSNSFNKTYNDEESTGLDDINFDEINF